MTPFLNRITVMGNLGKKPELRYLTDGTAATTAHIAYSEKYPDRETGQWREKTEWFTALLYGRQAETVCAHMNAGDSIQVHGKLRSRHYTDKTGQARTTWEIVADSMQMIVLRTPLHTPDGGGAAQTATAATPAPTQAGPTSLSACL